MSRRVDTEAGSMADKPSQGSDLWSADYSLGDLQPYAGVWNRIWLYEYRQAWFTAAYGVYR